VYRWEDDWAEKEFLYADLPARPVYSAVSCTCLSPLAIIVSVASGKRECVSCYCVARPRLTACMEGYPEDNKNSRTVALAALTQEAKKPLKRVL